MNIKKFTLILAATLCFGTTCAYAKTMEFTMNNTNLNILDGTVSSSVLETAPYTENDRTMVPIRVIAENFGADVAWNEATETVTVSKGDTNISLVLGNNVATVNGQSVDLDVSPKETNGRTMVPLRFVTENLGFDVRYVESTEQVIISDSPAVLSIEGVKVPYDAYKILYDINYANNPDLSDEDKVTLINNITYTLTDAYYFAENAEKSGLTLTADQIALVQSTLATTTEIDPSIMLNSTYAELLEIYQKAGLYSLKVSVVVAPTDDEIQNYYNENYISAKHILILSTSKDPEQTIDSIQIRLALGDDFDELMNKYSEDTGLKTYPDGYTFTKGEMVKEFEDAAYALDIDKVSDVVKSNYGYHIIKRVALPEITDDMKANVRATLGNEKFSTYIDEAESKADIKQFFSTDELVKMLSK